MQEHLTGRHTGITRPRSVQKQTKCCAMHARHPDHRTAQHPPCAWRRPPTVPPPALVPPAHSQPAVPCGLPLLPPEPWPWPAGSARQGRRPPRGRGWRRHPGRHPPPPPWWPCCCWAPRSAPQHCQRRKLPAALPPPAAPRPGGRPAVRMPGQQTPAPGCCWRAGWPR